MKFKANLIAGAAALLLGSIPCKADLITWGGGLGNQFLTSTGTPLDGSFTFELGTFDTFVPTELNVDDWAANWHVFDRATTTGVGPDPQWDPNLPMLLGSATITSAGLTSKAPDLALPLSDPNYINIDASYDFRGKTAMIWVFNNRGTHVGAEWGFFTGTFSDTNTPWAFPLTVALDCDCSLGADFNLADVTGSVVGSFDQPIVGGSTSTTLTTTVVPEPGGAILIFAAGMILLTKRKRSGACR
jgi:hypothetical protein